MKCVLDTNVIVAALISCDGVSNMLMQKLFMQERKICVISNPLVVEYEDVLLREKHRTMYPQFTSEDLKLFVDDICLIAKHQKINFLWRPFLRDIKDDMVLETAFNGRCDYIVTYNSKDFEGVRENFGIKVVTPKEFLKIVGAEK